MDATAPALDPPGVLSRFHGLRVTPVSGESPTGLQPNSLVVVLPMTIAPAARARSTAGASSGAMFSAITFDPNANGASPTEIRSFTDIGRPCNAPSAPPDMTASSAACAAAMASSGNITKNGVRSAWTVSARSSVCRVSSTGEISLRAIRRRSSVALI